MTDLITAEEAIAALKAEILDHGFHEEGQLMRITGIIAAELAACKEREAGLRNFVEDFAAAKIDALRFPRPLSPEDELDPVVEAEEVWAWQADARADTEAAHERGMDEAADKILDWLAKAVGAKEYTACDGSETWDGDVQGTIYAILKAGNVYDEEDGRVAKLADTEAAVALALEEAADLHAKLWRETSAYKESQIRALAPASGVAKLAALRAERDEWKAVSKTLSEMQAGEYKRADTLAAELAAANAREAGLREASALLRGHAGAAASLLRKFGISESVAEFLEAAVAEHDAALAQPSTEGGE